MIVANGGDANSGAPSNNFAGQEEQPLSAAILEVDLTMLKTMPVLDDDGRAYVYDLPTMNDPSRADAGNDDVNDPFGGNDSKNSAKLLDDGPVSIYSPGYRNAYDVEVTEDGRVWTYDNGANNSWGGRPIGEAGDDNTTDNAQAPGYIATNLNNGEGNSNDDINLVDWNPSNKDNFHEVTRSDDLNGGALSVGGNGAVTTFTGPDGLTYVYGGHPNPTRAEGAMAGLLFSPDAGTDNAYLLVSVFDTYDDDGDGDAMTNTDYDQVIAWLAEVEANDADFPSNGIFGAGTGDLTKKVLAVMPGVPYDIYSFADGSGAAVVAGGAAPAGGTLQGTAGLPADIAEIVAYRNPVEGDYKEAGKTDGALDTGNGSINGLAEYTSTILDGGGTKMSGAILATQLGGGNIIVMGRNEDGSMSSTVSGGFATAADRTIIAAGGGPLGITTVGDDYIERGLTQPFQGSIWSAVYQQNGPLIEIFQPNNGAVPLAGSEIVNPTDRDLDGVDYVADPFEFSDDNGYAIAPGQKIVLDFNPQNTNFPTSLSGTGLLGAALDGETANTDAQTAFENFPVDQQFDGLYDIGGNVLPGGNAPILQIKKVIEGTVVGTANSARDVLHTGVLPSADTDRIVATMNLKNWIPAEGGVAPGQLTGMIFGDGTQANFVRLVFGAVDLGGGPVPGIEVGYEIGDVNYTVVERIALPALSNAAISLLELRLSINKADGFAVGAAYRLEGETEFTALDLGGFALPAGVLQDVLTGAHTIGTGPAEQTSGAAFGFLAETSAGNDLEAVDFNELAIEAFGNEIPADTAAEVGLPGSANIDTVIYTGPDTALAPLASNVENFDGTGSTADFVLTANDLDNLIRVGSGTNTVTTGAGADSVRGTLADLNGDEITDFSVDDEVILEGATLTTIGTPTFGGGPGSATVTLGGATITLSGDDLADYDPADGGASINITQGADGVRITLEPALSPVIAISAGGADLLNATVRDQSVDFLSDAAGGAAAQYLTGVTSKSYTNATIAGTDIPDTVLDPIHQTERSAVDAGKWGYAIPVEDGSYLVDLYFAEIFHGVAGGTDGPGGRLFDIFVEDDTVETGLDVYAEAGGPAKELVKTYQATVTDGVLNIEFDASVDQAKLSGLVVWKVGGTFTPPPDSIAPEIVSIELPNPPSVQDGERFAIVTLSDETGFDAADFTALDGSELVFTGIVPDAVSAPALVLSDGGKTATLTYTLTRDDNSWPNGTGEVSVLADAYGDAAGNTTGAASAGFVLEANLASLVRGGLVRAINVGTTDTAAATNLGVDLVEGGTDNSRYGGAIAADSLITDAGGNPIAFEADDAAYYTAPKTDAQLNANVDGQSGTTGSNSGGVDLDGSAYHTYRDSGADTWTATYSGFENGTYVVELHFAELFQTAPNTRVGDFYIQGQLVLDDFDVFAEAGGADRPISRTHNVTVTDGTITVTVDSSQGQAGYSAIAIYDAVPSDLPPTVSVGDVTVAEGADATLVFTRIGDLTEAVTIDYSVTPGSADAGDYTAAATGQVTIPAGQGGVTLTIPTVDDADEEGAESFTVTITGVSAGADIGDGSATVTIQASDSDLQAPVGATIFELDFEGVTGEPLAVGGFDGALGTNNAVTIVDADAEITGGKLVVQTSEGDINDGTDNASNNDFTKTVDLSDPALTEIYLTTRFDNPFDAAFFTANGLTGTFVPNYAQQGIVIGTGTQLAGEMVKLVWGGVAGGADTGVQIWTKGSGANGLDQKVTLEAMAPGVALFDVASVELTMRIDKAAGTVAQFVTLYDASGAVLGGSRPDAAPGFATAAPVTLTAQVLNNITSDAAPTHVGVHSSDNSSPAENVGSFEATWDFLRLSSPQFTETGGDALVSIAAPADAIEGGDTGATDLVFALSADDGLTGSLEITLSVNGTETVETIGFVDGAASFTVSVAQDSRWNGTESVEVAIVSVGTAGHAPNPSAATATGNVTEDDPADAFAGAPVGDFSDDRLAPTDVGALQLGETVIAASQQGDAAPGGRDRDFITFTVAAGQALRHLWLDGYDTTEITQQAFMGLQAGPAITVDPLTGAPDAGQPGLLAGIVYGPSGPDALDLLPILADGDPADAQGQDFPGFTLPLAAGTYTLWLNQGGPSTTLNLRLVTEALVPTVTISDATPVLEADGARLEFALTASDATLDGQTVTVTYDTADAAGLTQDVLFTGTTGTLTIDVVNDDVADGDDIVTVTLTGASGGVLVDATPASGTVTEDDVDAGLPKGALVLAINAGPAGAIAGDAIEGIDFGADAGFSTPSSTFTDTGSGGDTNGNAAAFDGTIYETERFAKLLTYTLTQKADGTPLVNGEQYVLELYFAELYQSAVGARKFDVTLNGTEVLADDLDVFAEVGLDDPATAEVEGLYRIQTLATVVDGAITVELNANDAVGGADNAKINGLALFEAPVDPTAVSVSVADVTVDEDAAEATITFTRTGASTEAVTISYSTADGTATAGADYTAVSASVEIPAGGDGIVTVTVPLTGDTVEEVDETFTITIDAATAPSNTVTVADASATVTLTDNDAPALPVGFGPGDDLDQDGSANADDDDIDGDGALNGDETFVYDGTNAGTALTAGQVVTLGFDTDGTPFENGLTGALLSPNKPAAPEIDLGNASVLNGNLNVTATTGDHFNANNTQQNALVAGFTAVEGLRVETRFAMPDFNPATSEVRDAPANYQAAGVVIGFDQDNLVKAVFGRGAAQFQLVQDNAAGLGVSELLTSPVYPDGLGLADVAEVSISLEVFIDDSGAEPLAKARAFATFFDAAGQAIPGTEDLAIGEITLEDQAQIANGSKGTSLASQVLNGAVLGAGVIQTGTGANIGFDVSYQYLEITALGTPPVDLPPSVAVPLEDQNPAEDAVWSFAVPAGTFADDAGEGALTLAATLADGTTPLPAWLDFDPATATFSGTPLQADVDAGPIAVRVTATDASGQAVSDEFTVTPSNVNDAPTVSGTLADAATTVGAATSVDLSGLTLADEDGDAVTLRAELQGGLRFPPGSRWRRTGPRSRSPTPWPRASTPSTSSPTTPRRIPPRRSASP